ncbi:MAG: hypothetical protein DIU61_015370 [Bacteroidota bacterium]|jgi:hypothetical protein|nr:MAG: hypothetical protein DIU61_17345 [Bacteroidota bacterium]
MKACVSTSLRVLPALALMLYAACSGSRTEGSEATVSCYSYATPDDSIMLRLSQRGDAVEGELTYYLKEKDANRGTLEGTMHNDTLFAEYTFQSEGVTSVREIAFIRRGNALVEAFGEVEERDGKFVFIDRSLITPNENVILRQIDCGPE